MPAIASIARIRPAEAEHTPRGEGIEIEDIVANVLADLSLIELVATALKDEHPHAFNSLQLAKRSLRAQVERLKRFDSPPLERASGSDTTPTSSETDARPNVILSGNEGDTSLLRRMMPPRNPTRSRSWPSHHSSRSRHKASEQISWASERWITKGCWLKLRLRRDPNGFNSSSVR